eukprot:TRINITY_DN14636_c0_g1_i2.p1 TRINITY_DN14636_c0_g1~~TRINITY_DN14636_c0_g1_i2.p1  ORF type:complete len:370 (-),score=51.10 TRINITY_DN14636_c0_g1_i2:94-1203(-)
MSQKASKLSALSLGVSPARICTLSERELAARSLGCRGIKKLKNDIFEIPEHNENAEVSNTSLRKTEGNNETSSTHNKVSRLDNYSRRENRLNSLLDNDEDVKNSSISEYLSMLDSKENAPNRKPSAKCFNKQSKQAQPRTQTKFSQSSRKNSPDTSPNHLICSVKLSNEASGNVKSAFVDLIRNINHPPQKIPSQPSKSLIKYGQTQKSSHGLGNTIQTRNKNTDTRVPLRDKDLNTKHNLQINISKIGNVSPSISARQSGILSDRAGQARYKSPESTEPHSARNSNMPKKTLSQGNLFKNVAKKSIVNSIKSNQRKSSDMNEVVQIFDHIKYSLASLRTSKEEAYTALVSKLKTLLLEEKDIISRIEK